MLLSFVDNSSKFLFVSPNLILVPSLAAFELSYTNFNSRVVISRMEFKRYTFSVIDLYRSISAREDSSSQYLPKFR